MRTSRPWARWYAIVIASANRLASSYTPRGPMGLTWPQYDSGWGWTCGSPYTSLVEARKNRADLALASPRQLWVPRLPTFRIWMGMRSKSAGGGGGGGGGTAACGARP